MKTNIQIDIIWVIVGVIVVFVLLRQCEGEVKTVTKTEIKYVPQTETVEKVVIQEIPKNVIIEKVKTIKGKDSIIYLKDSTPTSINTKQYETKLESNNAVANLKITADELYDVSGTITYPEKQTTTTTIKTRDASGFYIYGQLPINNLTSPEVGVLFQLKNRAFISGGIQYNNFTKQPDFNIGIGIRL